MALARLVTSGAPLVLHLNGPPGVGKSTLARRWADDHPGTLLLEIDALRTWVSGWREDFAGTGAQVRETALAMITAYAASGGDVVLPQLIASAGELARFEAAAVAADARFIEVILEVEPPELRRRFAGRPVDQPWLEAVHALVDQAPDGHLAEYVGRLRSLAAGRRGVVLLPTVTGDVDGAYAALSAAVTAAGVGPTTPSSDPDGRSGTPTELPYGSLDDPPQPRAGPSIRFPRARGGGGPGWLRSTGNRTGGAGSGPPRRPGSR